MELDEDLTDMIYMSIREQIKTQPLEKLAEVYIASLMLTAEIYSIIKNNYDKENAEKFLELWRKTINNFDALANHKFKRTVN